MKLIQSLFFVSMMLGSKLSFAAVAVQASDVVVSSESKALGWRHATVCVNNTQVDGDVSFQYRYLFANDNAATKEWTEYKASKNTLNNFRLRFPAGMELGKFQVKFMNKVGDDAIEMNYDLDRSITMIPMTSCDGGVESYAFEQTRGDAPVLDLVHSH